MKKNRNKIKIFFLIPSLRGGGAEKIILNIVKNINLKKFNPTLILISNEGEYTIPKNIKVINIDKKRARYAIPKLVKIIKNNKPDIVLSSVVQSGIILSIAKKFIFKNKPIIVHRVANFFSNINIPFPSKILYKKTLKSFDSIISVSDEMKEDLEKNTKLKSKQIQTIYNPIDLKKIDIKSNEEIEEKFISNSKNKIILGVGSLTKQKGFKYLIKACEQIVKNRRNTYLVILGKGKKREELTELIKKLKIEDKVKLLGFKNNPYKYMKRANVFVLPSLWEGLPGVLIEAMACGTPVISTSCQSGPKEILKNEKYGILIPIKDHKQMRKEIKSLLNKDRKAEKMGKMAKKRVKKFNLKKQVKKYETKLLRSVNKL